MESDLAMIFLFAGNFAPRGFATCAGQLLSIAQNTAVFSLLGTTYGGNGTTNFALPDLRGRVAIGQGQGPGLSSYVEGQIGGSETMTLLSNNLPTHTHTLNVNNAAGTTGTPSNTTYLAQGPTTGSGPNAQVQKIYTTNAPNTALGPLSISGGGGNQPFSIMQPYLALFYIIALEGIFPSRN